MGVWELTIENDAFACSDGMYAILGFDQNEAAINLDFFLHLVIENDRPLVAAQLQQTIYTGHPLSVICSIVTKQLTEKKIVLKGTLCKTDAGKPIAVSGYVQELAVDTTPLSAAEKTAYETALKDSEKKYSYLFDNSPSIMIVWDFETLKIIDVNMEAVTKYGYTRDEFLALDIKQIRPAEDIPLLEAFVKNPETYGSVHKNVWRHKKKNGEIMYIEVNARLLRYNGRLVSINHNIDVTEKVLTEKALKASDAKYKQLFNYSPMPMWIYDLQTFKILEVNDMAVTKYGYSRDEFLQMTILDFRPVQYAQQVSTTLQNLNPTQQVFHFGVYDHLKKDGSLLKADISCFRMPYEQKDCMLVTSFDVSEKQAAFERLKEHEQKLLQSEQQLSLIYNTVTDIIFVLAVEKDNRFLFQSINHAFTQATGLAEEGIIGQYVDEIIPQPSLNDAISKYQEAIKTKGKITWEETSTYPTGVKTGIVTVAPIFNDNGTCIQLIGSITDISAQKTIQTALEERNVFIETAFDNLPIGIAVNTISEGTGTLMNLQFSKIYGWPAEILSDLSAFLNHICPDAAYGEALRKRILDDIHSRDISRMNWEGIEIRTSTGEQRIVNAKNIPLYEQNLMISTVVDVTESIKAQNALKISNERFEYATKATSDAIWEWNIPDGTLFWGERYSEIFGHPLQGLHADLECWRNNIHPQDAERVIKKIYASIGGNDEYWEDEYRYRKANNDYAYVTDRGFLMRDANGQALKMVGSMRDITSRKERERQLKLLESVITHTNDAVMITEAEPVGTPGPRILYVNNAFTEMTGYTADEVIGKTPRILQGPNSNQRELGRIGNCLKNWQPCEATIINYKKNGEAFWIQFSISPVADENGWFTHWIAIERDVTEQKNIEQNLRAAYEERNAILESIGDAFFAMDNHYVVTYWNSKAEILMKKSRQEIIGRDLRDVYPPYPGRITYLHYNKAMAENKAQYFEVYNADVDGWFDVSVFPSSGGLSVYFRDVTDRLRHQKAIEEQNKKLREIAWMQSHVVRAPLSKIMGLVNLIKDEAVPYVEKMALLAYLTASAHELDEIINSIANSTDSAKVHLKGPA